MNTIINNELNSFREYRNNYNFKQKKIVQIGEDLYCDDELLQKGDEKPIGETEKWINVGYKLKGSFSKVLSNLFPYEFYFRDQKLSCIETFFQGIKIKDKEVQEYIFKYTGLDSNNIKVASDFDWKKEGIVYWQGTPIKRDSQPYNDLVDELYISAIQNPLYRNVLKKVDKPIIHSIGETDKNETVFTRYEFEYMVNCLSSFVKQ